MMTSDVIDAQQAVRVTPKKDRRTSPFLTKYELAKVVGERAKQLSSGTTPFVFDAGRRREGIARNPSLTPISPISFGMASAVSESKLIGLRCASSGSQASMSSPTGALMLSTDPVMIAKYELLEGCIPFIVRRTFPGGEYWEDIPLWELRVDASMLDLVALRGVH